MIGALHNKFLLKTFQLKQGVGEFVSIFFSLFQGDKFSPRTQFSAVLKLKGDYANSQITFTISGFEYDIESALVISAETTYDTIRYDATINYEIINV